MIRDVIHQGQADAAERERVQDAMRAVCQERHSPRYITRLFDNGERMLDFGYMKVHEAAGVIEQAEGEFTGAELVAAREHFVRMQSLHLKNLYLGIGHQSPMEWIPNLFYYGRMVMQSWHI